MSFFSPREMQRNVKSIATEIEIEHNSHIETKQLTKEIIMQHRNTIDIMLDQISDWIVSYRLGKEIYNLRDKIERKREELSRIHQLIVMSAAEDKTLWVKRLNNFQRELRAIKKIEGFEDVK